jgi:hypothetical protein
LIVENNLKIVANEILSYYFETRRIAHLISGKGEISRLLGVAGAS